MNLNAIPRWSRPGTPGNGRRSRWLVELLHDVRHAALLLRQNPAFSAVSIATIALCIGANSAVFGAVYAILFRPLPFDRPDQLYVLDATYRGAGREFTSIADAADWRALNHVFTEMAAMHGAAASLTTPSGPEFVNGVEVSEDFFALLHVEPNPGRRFLSSEYRIEPARVVILSQTLWRRAFGANPAAIGSSVVLDDERYTIVGVMPPAFSFPEDAQFWRPLALVSSDVNRRADLVRVIGRLRPGIPQIQARADMRRIAEILAKRYPKTNAEWGVELVSLRAKSTERTRMTWLALWAAVGCVLLIGCVNLALLLLARGANRAHEFAVRATLGAGRSRLVRQLLAETTLMTVAGGASSLVVANWVMTGLHRANPAAPLPADALRLDWPVLVFTASTSIGTGILVGLVPAWRITAIGAAAWLKPSGALKTVRHHRLMNVLAAVQIAISIVLLTGAGLMVRTVERLHAVALGFDSERLLTFYLSLPAARYQTDAQIRTFFDEVLTRIRATPGVQDASAINALYVNWAHALVLPVLVEGRPAPDRSHPPDTHVRIVDPELHRVLQIPVLRGRLFTADDGPGYPLRAIINQAMWRRYFSNEDPIGRRISVRGAPGRPEWAEIVGVIGDVRQYSLDTDVSPEIQLSSKQAPISTMAILVRTASAPLSVARPIRAAMQALDPNLPLITLQTMDDVLARSAAGRQSAFRVLSAFSVLALFLTTLGLYGVVTARVADRTHEMAVRIALGASTRRMLWMVVCQTINVALVGVCCGWILSGIGLRYLQPLLFGIAPTDSPTYVATAVIMLLIALVSSTVPAYRALRVDPAATLRIE